MSEAVGESIAPFTFLSELQSCPSEHLKLLVSQAFKDYYSIMNLLVMFF
jgi:hypothetical protein